MATVSTLLSNLANNLNDPNAQVFTQALRLTALNNAQNELVIRLLGLGAGDNKKIYDLLSDIVETETQSVSTSGYDLSGMSNRYFLRNGFINSRVTIDGEYKYVTRMGLDKIGITQNYFFAGHDEDPVCYLVGNKYYIDVSVGSYPINVTFWYVGQPYNLAASASGSGPSQSVATPDLNVIMHDLLTLMAERDLRRHRGDPTDFKEAQELEQLITIQIQSLVMGDKAEPESNTLGQHERDDDGLEQR